MLDSNWHTQKLTIARLGNPNDVSKLDVNVATGLLKTLLRELPGM